MVTSVPVRKAVAIGDSPSASMVSPRDLEVVRRFVEHPSDFVQGRTGVSVSAAQVGARNNPFGDYAPQSTQIQGILKGMYDTFAGDLERANADESEAQKSFEELMATKLREHGTLKATQEAHELDHATKSKSLADNQELLDDTKAQLDADEKFFAETKEGCSVKAQHWSERTRLRSEELAGIARCIQILSSEDAKAIFDAAHSTFLQLASKVTPSGRDGHKRMAAFSKVKGLAAEFKNRPLAEIALQLKNGGHFDKVMASIDTMIARLREEEQADVAHRDRCQGAENKNTNDLEDLAHGISQAEGLITRLGTEAGTLQSDLDALKDDINKTLQDRETRLNLRNVEHSEFVTALKDDTDAVALLGKAITYMTEFYKRNKMSMSLLSKKEATSTTDVPEVTVDPDKAPETSWSGPKYSGSGSETEGVVAILEMIKEDLEREIQTARADDAKAQEFYLKDDASMKETLDSQLATKLAMERELQELQARIADAEGMKTAKESDKLAEDKLKDAIYSDCAWVATHFDTRRDKRKAEIQGLQEAKGYLAGVESGDDLLAPP